MHYLRFCIILSSTLRIQRALLPYRILVPIIAHLNFQNIVTYTYEVQFLQNLSHVGIEGVDFNLQFTMFNNLIVFVHNIENSELLYFIKEMCH